MTERTTVRLPEELLQKARIKAAEEGRTLTSLIEDGLRLVVADQHEAAKRKRVIPRVSKATGGFKPGMEHMTYSQLEELEDLEYAERLKRGFK